MAATTIDPDRHHAVLLDLDGVLIDTASLHAAAWGQLFDEYLARRPPSSREDHRPFTDADYTSQIAGKPRVDGVVDFLRSRGIEIPRGQSDDEAGRETGHGLGKLKDHCFRLAIDARGVAAFGDVVAFVESLRRHGIGTAVTSASRNCALMLEKAGVAGLFDVRIDGVLADELGLPGKPDPAFFLEAARRLDTAPSASVVVEDAEAGVEAARKGGFGHVIGVARTGPTSWLLDAGADVSVSTLADIAVAAPGERRLSTIPDAVAHRDEIAARLRHRRPVVLLDFDGTLTPIRNDPARVTLSVRNRLVLQTLARRCPVAILSGRDLQDIRHRVRLAGLWYAGSHGFELAGPADEVIAAQSGEAILPDLDEAERRLSIELADVRGAVIDRKRFALAVHYRNVRPEEADHVITTVRRAGDRLPSLKTTRGRFVVELLPNVDWNKGRALRWLLERLGLADSPDVVPVYAGDDLTDEDALHEIHNDGIGIVVRSAEHGDRLTWAHYSVDSPRELSHLLRHIASIAKETA